MPFRLPCCLSMFLLQLWPIPTKFCTNFMPLGASPHSTLFIFLRSVCRPYGAVGTAIRYGLDGPGIEFRLGRDFPHTYRLVLGPNQPPIKWVPGLFSGGKATATWRSPPTPPGVKVKGRVELYFYCSTGPSWPDLVWTLQLVIQKKTADTLITLKWCLV
jgi:hypothetical protein